MYELYKVIKGLFKKIPYITLHRNYFVWRHARQKLLLFQFAVISGSHIVVQYTAINITASLTTFNP